MIAHGNEVYVTGPNQDFMDEILALGVKRFIEVPMVKDNTSVKDDLQYLINLKKAVREIKPDMVFAYNIKPVVYGSVAASAAGVKKTYALLSFNFIMPNELTIKNQQELSTMVQITVLCMSVSKQFLALSVVGWCHKKYIRISRNQWLYSLFALIVMALNVCIYTGTNRLDMITMAVASVLLYVKLFPRMQRFAGIVAVVGLLVMVSALSQFRRVGIINIDDGLTGFLSGATEIMWGYTGSPYNVAIAIETAEAFPAGRNLMTLIYDFLRPTLGLNLLMQNVNLKYSNLYFNMQYYSAAVSKATQIMPMIGEGDYLLGFAAAPLLSVIWVSFALFLSRMREYSKDVRISYFMTISCCRIGFFMGQNSSIQMNDLSFSIFVPLLLIYFSNKFVVKKG